MKQQDCLRRFIFEEHGVRGEWVRLEQSWKQAKQYQHLVNDAVDAQMGQALAAVVLLSATIKFKGAMIMQIQGGGDLKALVAQSSNERQIRGLVRSEATVAGANLLDMVGEGGRLVLTVESENAEPYQGIVGVEAETLADVLRTYFTQSEQLDTRLWLFANQTHAAGLFIQELPSSNQNKADWERIEILANTVTADELLSLDCEDLLHRLFHQEKVRIYDPEPVEFKCNCSRQKIGGTLAALGRSELEAILRERDDIEVDCQFCGAQYHFDKVDVENLLTNPAAETDNHSPTRH
ncbi:MULTISPECIES: Hsp33 family molecular chaperone HslO [unclassified Methylomonas]|uniref:Hsp33 family molecular chaperone HslO n=1 Tax=unclassified Methylomonas TaxID=2608980 RepID=UPI000C330AD7|nr:MULTISPECIES: Hsp33 family molecular chaperone HslO [unclassified Methylomonas]NOV28182.1 Hsp33 family molecular chaperone HslO [Methylomonas sp. ZR1]PKD38352.1 Hsp33 family molecular chaperone HslO [Methylomonas sp. Kb3]